MSECNTSDHIVNDNNNNDNNINNIDEPFEIEELDTSNFSEKGYCPTLLSTINNNSVTHTDSSHTHNNSNTHNHK